MATIVVSYASHSPATVNSNTIALKANVGGAYEHDDKVVTQLDITLGTSTAAVLDITSSGTKMPKQKCFTSYGTNQTGSFKTRWLMSSNAAVGAMTITIPSSTSADYSAQMSIENGSAMEINVAR